VSGGAPIVECGDLGGGGLDPLVKAPGTSVFDRWPRTERCPWPAAEGKGHTVTFRTDLETRAELDRLLAAARKGDGDCLNLRGLARSSQAAVVDHAADAAGDMHLVRVSGTALEIEFRFAALHQMLASFLDGVDRLPPPQRQALRGVVGLAHDPNPDRFLVGLAVLTLMNGAAGDQPLLIVIEDAQWLDRASAEVLAFVARRLRGKPIAMVVAMCGPASGTAPFAAPPGQHLEDQPDARPAVAVAPVSRPDDRVAVDELRPLVAAALAAAAGADSELLATAYAAAGDLLDDHAQQAVANRWVRAERARCGPQSLPEALSALARVEILAGRLESAEATLVEARQVAAASGRASATAAVRLAELTVRACRGRDEPAGSAASHLGDDPGAPVAHAALTVGDLASGRYPAALARALDVPPDLGMCILPDLIEAAVRTGDRAAAIAALDRFAERALASSTPLALGLLARSRALLADDTTADGLYREARAYLEQTSQTPQLARTRLLHGEWLRRRRRHRDAREHLGAAADMFEAMEMDSFLQRTRVELRATGDRSRRCAGEASDHLTSQEAEIARLVADGLTNRDIATRLFISSNTVEYHLHKVFRKFTVTSRTQLAHAVLTADPSTVLPGSPVPASR
jgi:DNA-binding CsgD family transcriptional regulator